MISLPSNPGTGEGTEEEESREEAKGSIGMNTFQDSSSVTEHLFQAEDHAQPSEGILINSRQVYSQGDKSVNSSVKSDMQGDNLSYKEFLIALYRTNGVPQLLILCVFLSFGFGTLGIAPAITSDRYARLLYGYDGPVCSLSGSDGTEPEACSLGSDTAQSAAAYATVFQYSLSFITSPFVGSLSDRMGRKGFMLAGVFLFNMGPLFLLFVQVIPTLNPAWYFVANSSPGLLSWYGICYAIMSDVVPPGLRAPALSLIQIFAFSATSFVPLLAVIFGHTGAALISSAFCGLGLLYGAIFLPETLKLENKKEAIRKRNEELKNVSTLLSLICRPVRDMSLLNRNRFFRLIPFVVILNGMVVAGDKIILLFYVQGQLGFSDFQISVLVLIHSFVALCVQTFMLKKLVQQIGERYVLIISMIFGIIYNFLYGISTSSAVVMFAIAVSAVAGMGYPTASSMMSFNVDEDEQGKAQGVFYSLTALSNAVGPISMQLVYDLTKDGAFLGPGSMFILASAFYVIGTVFSILLPPELSNSKNIEVLETENERMEALEEQSEDTYFV